MDEKPQIYLPTSRFVSGSMTEKRTKNARQQPIPEEKQQYEFGLALEKGHPDAPAFFGQLIAAAKACYPNQPQVHQLIDQWMQNGMNGFSMKVSDGAQPNKQGRVNEHTANHFVIWCSSNYINTIAENGAQIDPAQIERGYFVDATLTLAPNGNAVGDGIGVFMNPTLIRLRGQGEIIRGGIDIEAINAAMPMSAMPSGAQPIGSAPAGSPAMPGMPGQQPQQPQQPQYQPQQPQYQPQQQPQQPPQDTLPGLPPQGQPQGGNGLPGTGMSSQPTAPQTSSPSNNQQHPPHYGVLPNT